MSTDTVPPVKDILRVTVDRAACRCNCPFPCTMSQCITALSSKLVPLVPSDIDHARAIRAILVQYRNPGINHAATDWLSRIELRGNFQSTANAKAIERRRKATLVARDNLIAAITYAICSPYF